jgi:hypothetical protein
MDSYDAQMLDFSGDMDVHMHTTLSSPKPWTQPESIMEEDVHPIHLPNPFPAPPPQQDVEVDMDYYYQENVEYEMVDGEVTVPDAELVDIDVYDAPREEATAVPAAILHSAGQDLVGKLSEVHHPPSSNGVAAEGAPPAPNLEPPFRQSVEPDLLTPSVPQAGSVDTRDTTTSDLSNSALSPRASTPTSEAAPKIASHEEEVPVASERQVDTLAIAAADGTSNNNPSGLLDESQQRSVLRFSTVDRESSFVVPEAVTLESSAKETLDQAQAQDGETHENAQEHGDSYESEFPGPALDGTEVAELERPPLPPHESYETEEDNGDPHEISEGVYIEPPPAVLLELPSSSAHTECTLFATPENFVSDDSETIAPSPQVPILLQSRPTLYYETLNDVFEGLRQEEHIQSFLEFIDGEMMIDAYELQLVVSEVIFIPFSS